MLTPTLARERATAGAAYLDETQPDWSKIDLKTLDVSSKCHCVLGQLYPSYNEAVENLTMAERQAFGFEVQLQFSTMIPDYRLLTQAWRDVITERRTHAE